MLVERLPSWVAGPAGALSIIAGISGSALVFWAVVYGSYLAAVLGGVVFLVAALLWYAADLAGSEHPLA